MFNESNYTFNIWSMLWQTYWLDKNTSSMPYPNKIWNVKSPLEMAIKTSIIVPIGIVGIFLNVIILTVISKNKHLWSSSNLLIANMAFADFLTLLFCPWFTLVKDFHQNYVLKNFGCRFEGFIHAICILAGVSAVMLVSYDRLALVALTSDARITKKTAPRLIAVAWIAAILLSTPWIAFREYLTIEWLDYIEIFCLIHLEILGIYWHFIVVVFVWIPLILLVITYGTILWSLNRSKKFFASRGAGESIAKARSRAMRITACVLLAATVCRLPYTILVLIRSRLYRMGELWNGDSVDGFWFTVNTLMYLDCAINPLIYGFTNERFKRAMDRTPFISRFKFGSWCCVCTSNTTTSQNTSTVRRDKVYIIEESPKPNKKLTKLVNTVLQKDTFDLEQEKVVETDNNGPKLESNKDALIKMHTLPNDQINAINNMTKT